MNVSMQWLITIAASLLNFVLLCTMLSVMHCLTAVIIFAVIQICSCDVKDYNPDSEEDARKYLDYLEQKVCYEGRYKQESATYDYNTNITDENLKRYKEELAKPPLFDAEFVSFNWDCFDPDLKRQAMFYNLLDKPVDPVAYKAYGEVIATMVDLGGTPPETCIYNSTVCGPEASDIMYAAFENSRDPKELQFYWEQNRVPVATLIRPVWKQYVDSSNKVSQSKGYANRAVESMGVFEAPPAPEFKKFLMDLWEEFKPIYQQLHAYIRGRLRDRFGSDAVSKKGPIPVHLYDIFYGGDIAAYLKYLHPYPDKKQGVFTTVTDEMKKQNYTVKKIIDLIEDFYLSLGLEQLPDSLFKYSMFEKPKGRRVLCAPISYDFCNRKDYRIQYCTDISLYDFQVLLHEFGHVHNFVAYKDLPCSYRDSTKSGLVEAIADTMVLAVSSSKYLQRIGLILDECDKDPEEELNDFYDIFLNTAGFGPISLIEDLWRWSLFAGEVPEEHYNQAYWDLRYKIQGVVPSTAKNIENFLDAANNFLMLEDIPSINYFLCALAEFQFYEALCIIAGQYDPNDPNSEPLHNCDLYGSKEAGDKWHEVLKLGNTKPYTAILEIINAGTKLSAASVLRYFEPLHKFFIAENKRKGEFIGWE